MTNLEMLFRNDRTFQIEVIKHLVGRKLAPDSGTTPWLLAEHVTPRGPWPRDCDPEQCPYVASLFEEIRDGLLEKSKEIDGTAVWEPSSFAFAARRIRGNADALKKALRGGDGD